MPTTDELFQRVYEAPGDDAPRLVLADALQQDGDPRGEFIALQLGSSSRARKRADKLLERHRADFLGPLRSVVVVGTDEWERGFPVACIARLDGSLAACPAFATVKRLGLTLTQARPTELAGRWMTSLQEVYVATTDWYSDDLVERWRAQWTLADDVLRSVGREALLKPGFGRR
jgi:uncharacterized protein (TIGR02996 family)